MAEQIDELSKKTLGSYIKKASGSEDDPRRDNIGKSINLRDTQKFMDNPNNRMFGKDYNPSHLAKAIRKDKNRSAGIKTSVKKLTKESEEQEMPIIRDLLNFAAESNAVDFTSAFKDILSAKAQDVVDVMQESALKNAVADLDEDDLDFGSEDGELSEEQLEWIAENITEEEFEQLDELSRGMLKSYVRKAEKSNNKVVKNFMRDRKWNSEDDQKTNSKRVSGIVNAKNKLEEDANDE